MKKVTENWLKIAAKELRIAEASLKVGESIGVVFHLHAAIEKTLKAIYEETKGNPPKIHMLKRLAIDSCGIKLQKDHSDLLELLDKAFIDSRYPDSIEQFETDYNINSCKELIENTKISNKMAEIFNERNLKSIVNDYIDKLKGIINIDKAILFGSYAKGTANECSDIDLLIISKDLPENKSKGLNGLYLDRIVKDFDLSLAVIGIHPNKLNNEITKSFFDDILKTGKVLYPQDKAKDIAA